MACSSTINQDEPGLICHWIGLTSSIWEALDVFKDQDHNVIKGSTSSTAQQTYRAGHSKACTCAICRFQTTFLGSRGLTGKLVAEGMLEQEDRNGETLSDVLYKHGYQGSEEALARAAYIPDQVRGCLHSLLRPLHCLSACPVNDVAGQGMMPFFQQASQPVQRVHVM